VYGARDLTVICIGTGPSLTVEQVAVARTKGRLFGCNNAFVMAPDLELLYACNWAWWEMYWEDVRYLPCEKWTTNREAADKFGLNWIAEKNAPGLSTDPNVIHHGHGSGYSLVSMAYRAGARRILLLGYDLKYAPDYDGRARQAGSGPRHFFGEYPEPMQHWPSVKVKGGVHVELVELYRSIHEQALVEIINCTPGSALEGVIPTMDIHAV
jgi:hypothetical protein